MLGEAGGAESSPFWRQRPDKALLSGTQGSHEWLCKQPKREGTFPLAESAVKRFPVTVIAAFGGIISVQAVGGGGEGAGRQGKAPETSGLLAELRDSPRRSQVPDAERLLPAAGLCTNVLDPSFPAGGQSPLLGSPRGRPHTHSVLPLLRFPGLYCFKDFRAISNFLGP